MFFVVCCLLFVVCCLLFVVCFLCFLCFCVFFFGAAKSFKFMVCFLSCSLFFVACLCRCCFVFLFFFFLENSSCFFFFFGRSAAPATHKPGPKFSIAFSGLDEAQNDIAQGLANPKKSVLRMNYHDDVVPETTHLVLGSKKVRLKKKIVSFSEKGLATSTFSTKVKSNFNQKSEIIEGFYFLFFFFFLLFSLFCFLFFCCCVFFFADFFLRNFLQSRTLKVLKAIAAGIWVVDFQWVLASLEKEDWVACEKFETNFYTGAKKSRAVRKSNKASELLFASKKILLGGKTQPPKENLIAMIEELGGSVVSGTGACDCVVVAEDAVEIYDKVIAKKT